jgi:hypothetical protein
VIVATATTTVHLSVPDAMAALADLELYRQANLKIGPTLETAPAEGTVLVAHCPRPWSLPLLPPRPARITVGPDEIVVAELPWIRPRLMSMRTQLRPRPLDAGTTRIELRTTLWGRGPLAGLLERAARGWLAEDLRAEAERLTAVLDRPRPIDPATTSPTLNRRTP